MPRDLFFSRVADQAWAVLRQDGRAVELHADLNDDVPQLGRVYKARVSNVLPAIQSAFVELGPELPAYLPAADLRLPGEADLDPLPPIEDRLKPGRDLLVQIAREGIADKAPRVTSRIRLPGRWLVYMRGDSEAKLARRIQDASERDRLARILARATRAESGLLARTAAVGVDEESLIRESDALAGEWGRIERAAAALPGSGAVSPRPDLFTRVLRDLALDELSTVVVDRRDDEQQVREALLAAGAGHVIVQREATPVFHRYDFFDEIRRALRRRVWLPGGGTVILEQTEALVSIDVNTGRHGGGRSAEQTRLEVNLEAMAAIAREMRLRDLGGIVAIDCVEMRVAENRRRVEAVLFDALRHDPARTKILEMNSLGLILLTRKRTRRGSLAQLTEPCAACRGGRHLRPAVVAARLLAEARHSRRESPDDRLTLHADSRVVEQLKREPFVAAFAGSMPALVANEEVPSAIHRCEVRRSVG